MSRYTLLFGIAVACGCGPADDVTTQKASVPGSVQNVPAEASAFRLDETKKVIYLDTRIAPGQRRRFDIGQGSITVETLRVAEGKLTFHYTPEVEGGYTVYECTIPISATPIKFIVNQNGTPGKTSFDLTKCKVIRSGNVHFDK